MKIKQMLIALGRTIKNLILYLLTAMFNIFKKSGFIFIKWIVQHSLGNKNIHLGKFEKAILRLLSNWLFPFVQDSAMRMEYLRYLQSCGLTALPDRYFEPVPRVDDIDLVTAKPLLIAAPPIETPDMCIINSLLCQPALVSEFETKYFSKIAGNGMFGALDSFAYMYFIGKHKPQLIVEIGSGYTAQVALWASTDSSIDTKVVSIEPFPSNFLLDLNSRETQHVLVRKRIQDLALTENDFFSELKENDILFIDSTHVCSIGGDLPTIFCFILPMLRTGVIIHVHDVSWPYEYPRQLVFKSGRFYNELYLISTLLNHSNYDYLYGSYDLLMRKGIWLEPSKEFPYSSGMSLWIRKN